MPDSPAPPSVVAYLDEQIETLRDRLPVAARDFEADAVHKARVATRRIKAGLELLEWVTDGKARKRLGKVGTKVRRALGPLRDADVMLGHLGDLAAADPRHAAAVEWLSDRLRADQEKHRAKVGKKLDVYDLLDKLGGWNPLRQQALDAAEAIDSRSAESVHLQLDALVGRRDPVGSGRLDVHQVRIAAKGLRYTLELASAEGAELPKRVFKAFKSMQDALGLWHDFAVLTGRALAEAVDADLAAHDPDGLRGVLALATATLARSRKHLAAFERQWRRGGESLVEKVRGRFPLAVAVSPATAEDVTGS